MILGIVGISEMQKCGVCNINFDSDRGGFAGFNGLSFVFWQFHYGFLAIKQPSGTHLERLLSTA